MRVLLDGSYVSLRGFAVSKDLSSSSGESTGMIYGFFRTLFSLRKKYRKDDFWVAWDSKPTAKIAKFSGYKANRVRPTTDKYDLSSQKTAIRTMCSHLGIPQLLMDGEEADDLIGSALDPIGENLIFSSDRDYLQLVDGTRTRLYVPKIAAVAEKFYDEKAVIDEYGVNPQQFVIWKVFRGDGSDNLPGVPRLPDDKIVKIAKMGGVDQVYKSTFPGFTANQYKAIVAFRPQAQINLDLMKIKRDLPINPLPSKFDRDAFFKMCDRYEMFSLKKEVDLFDSSSSEIGESNAACEVYGSG